MGWLSVAAPRTSVERATAIESTDVGRQNLGVPDLIFSSKQRKHSREEQKTHVTTTKQTAHQTSGRVCDEHTSLITTGRSVQATSLGASLGFLHLPDDPLHASLQALARLGRARLNLPRAVTNHVQVQSRRDLHHTRQAGLHTVHPHRSLQTKPAQERSCRTCTPR
jgi:hypothetical protein